MWKIYKNSFYFTFYKYPINLPSSLRTPQCPLSVNPHKHTSVITNKFGKADLIDLTAF